MFTPRFLGTCLSFLSAGLSLGASAQAANGSDITTVNSTAVPGAYLTYKQTTVCETTPNVKSYSGYVHLPPNTVPGQDYEIHTYFWFFESRKDASTAPLTLWLQGGPGAPSVTTPISENGPCTVNRDSTTTELNPFSWNNEVNMLYIDQPVQTGFSYDSLVSGTVDEVASPFLVEDIGPLNDNRPSNFTHPAGTFSSQNMSTTTNTTGQAAEVMWNVMQVWMQDFPKYTSPNKTFSIWSESYGGHYGPIFADFFTQQSNKMTASNSNTTSPSSNNLTPLQIDTVGIINGCIDSEIQIPFYPEFAFNNTYGIKAINETVYRAILEKGIPLCKNLTDTCLQLADEKDAGFKGNNEEVNKACQGAFNACFAGVHVPYFLSGKNVFDITSPILSSFPPKFAAGYLNRQDVQQDLGVPLNFTGLASSVSQVFNNTGDFMRGNSLSSLARLLDNGVKVALVYGDKDYQCNWLGGEKVSLDLVGKLAGDLVSGQKFLQAGYADIKTDSAAESGGLVRQVGSLSFSRVYGAGHSVPYYRPQVAQEIFHRVTFNRDIATGEIDLSKNASQYSTTGSASAFTSSVNPPEDEKLTTTRDCYIWDILETCDKTQKQFIANGTAITQDFIMVGFKTPDGKEVRYGKEGTVGRGGGGGGGGGGNVSVPISKAAATTGVAGRFAVMSTAGLVAVSIIIGILF
ncbi:alpha/beta-hydrolase [Rhypophila sp. PSN 637]